MLVSSRRGLLLGLGSIIAAPALVKADSLMSLRGLNMDPWVLGLHTSTVKHPGLILLSANDKRAPPIINVLKNKSISEIAHYLNTRENSINSFTYEKVRLSEVIKDKFCLNLYPEAKYERLDI